MHNVVDVVLRAMTASIRHLSCVRMVLPPPYWDWYWKDVMVDTGFVIRRDLRCLWQGRGRCAKNLYSGPDALPDP